MCQRRQSCSFVASRSMIEAAAEQAEQRSSGKAAEAAAAMAAVSGVAAYSCISARGTSLPRQQQWQLLLKVCMASAAEKQAMRGGRTSSLAPLTSTLALASSLRSISFSLVCRSQTHAAANHEQKTAATTASASDRHEGRRWAGSGGGGGAPHRPARCHTRSTAPQTPPRLQGGDERRREAVSGPGGAVAACARLGTGLAANRSLYSRPSSLKSPSRLTPTTGMVYRARLPKPARLRLQATAMIRGRSDVHEQYAASPNWARPGERKEVARPCGLWGLTLPIVRQSAVQGSLIKASSRQEAAHGANSPSCLERPSVHAPGRPAGWCIAQPSRNAAQHRPVWTALSIELLPPPLPCRHRRCSRHSSPFAAIPALRSTRRL